MKTLKKWYFTFALYWLLTTISMLKNKIEDNQSFERVLKMAFVGYIKMLAFLVLSLVIYSIIF